MVPFKPTKHQFHATVKVLFDRWRAYEGKVGREEALASALRAMDATKKAVKYRNPEKPSVRHHCHYTPEFRHWFAADLRATRLFIKELTLGTPKDSRGKIQEEKKGLTRKEEAKESLGGDAKKDERFEITGQEVSRLSRKQIRRPIYWRISDDFIKIQD